MILIACEESQEVCKAFRKMGHEAYSCDIQDCSGDNPEWHIKDDAIKILNSNDWELVIAHPPCTYLANSGVQHLHKNIDRWNKLKDSIDFFMKFYNYSGRIAIENPIPHKYSNLPKYNQIIEPYYFGDECTKKTCLWLKNLPPLMYSYIVNKGERYIGPDGKSNGSLWYSKSNSKNRSKTFPGIANAMALQWGSFIKNAPPLLTGGC
jgi:hypothetical protein